MEKKKKSNEEEDQKLLKEWKPEERVAQFLEETPIAPINYSSEFILFMDIFRYILKTNEISLRAFRLATKIIALNSGNYTAWYIRRKCIDKIPELSLNLEEEIKYLNRIGVEMSKVYQYWHHRRLIITKYNKVHDDEFEALLKIYDEDDKNYHMWSYRMWLVDHFQLWEREEKYIETILSEAPQNNSAWSYRFFIKFKKYNYASIVDKEIEFCKSIIEKDSNNESAWVYLKGLLIFAPNKFPNQSENEKVVQIYRKQIFEYCKKLADKNENCRFSRSLLVDLLCQNKENSKEAIKFCEQLVLADPIRCNYWNWRIDQIKMGGVKF